MIYKGTRIITDNHNDWWLIDKNNKQLTDIKFDYILCFKNDYTVCHKDDKQTFIKYTGEYLKKGLWFDSCEEFFHNIAVVRNNKKRFFIDLKGNNIFNVEFDAAYSFDDSLTTVVELYNKLYIIDINGYVIK
jgi:hypothetical protein